MSKYALIFTAVFDGLTNTMFADAKMAVVVELIVNLTRPISRAVPLIVVFTKVVLRSVTGIPLSAEFAVANAVVAVLRAVSAEVFTGAIILSTMLLIT